MTAVHLVLSRVMIIDPFKLARLKKTLQVVGAEEGAAPDLQKVRLDKFRGIVTRTPVLVKGEKRRILRGGKQLTRQQSTINGTQ